MRWLRSAASDREQVIVGDLVLLEILQGVSGEAKASAMERWLRAFIVLPMLNADRAVRAARNYRLLRGHGVTIRKTVDLVIGTFCLDHGLPLLHDDRDFDPMAQHLGLAVVRA